jgi:hypothetical protein
MQHNVILCCVNFVTKRGITLLKSITFITSPHVWTALVGQNLLIVEISRSHSDTLQSVGLLLWASDRPVVENST